MQNGEPAPSRFQLGGRVRPSAPEHMISAALENPWGVEFGDEVLIAVYAALERPGERRVVWGEGTAFQEGEHPMYFQHTVQECPPDEPPPPLDPSTITAGGNHSCGLTAIGTAYCWGWNDRGQLGDGTTTDRLTPIPVSGDLRFTVISAGDLHTCGVTTDGEAYCWGWNVSGQIGDGTTADRLTPEPVAAGGVRFHTISAALDHTCAVSDAGRAYCWGNGRDGVLGTLDIPDVCPGIPWAPACSTTPRPVSGGITFAAVSASVANTCGITPGGHAYCWGERDNGAIGDGITDGTCPIPGSLAAACAVAPVLIPGGRTFASISSGTGYTCGLTTTGEAYCWGFNATGQLGVGDATARLTPAPVAGGHTFTYLTANGGNIVTGHTCAITIAGEAYCWGGNTRGQLGRTTGDTCILAGNPFPCSLTPGAVSGSLRFRSLALGTQHTCGMAVDGEAYCWGFDARGQLGDGTTIERETPTPVLGWGDLASAPFGLNLIYALASPTGFPCPAVPAAGRAAAVRAG